MPGDDGAAARLREAEAREEELRRALNALVVEQRRAQTERTRYEQRSGLEGADPRVGHAARSEEQRAAELGAAVEAARAELRAQEGLVAKLRTGQG